VDILGRARAVLDAEAQAILHVPLSAGFVQAVEAIYRCKSKIIVKGMGKAGNIARKIASTLCSTGTPACFLHPGEAAHGDLGLVAPGDVLLAFSTSGKTREVLEIIELARRLEIGCVIAVTSHLDAPIRDLADIVIDMGEVDEPCRLGLTPTASTAVMMAIGDALALCVMDIRGFTRDDYGLRHHGGYLGQLSRGETYITPEGAIDENQLPEMRL